ncbi:rhomboid-related protein 3-like [Anoplophora glabripennis]|uniref:rhomboid-related protein 3-like n=1 Tax=Anoplophora glabripennis TaxID=217634 RepID=UPI000873CCFD|nr:rhomboid-related protein 3-like [Anoplophora glabripennis]
MQSTEHIVTCDKKTARIIRKSAILRNKDVVAYYKYIFNECDTNRDGQISISELKEFLATNEGDIPNHVVKCIHQKFDMDKDDQLNFDEFLDMISHPTVTETFKRIGSRYLKYVAESSVRRKSLKLRRTVTDTGMYEEQCTFNLCTVGILVLSVLQIMCFYVNRDNCNYCISNSTEFDPSKKYEIWRFVTFILDHSSESHLYGNVVIQILLGVPLEMVHSWRVPMIYFAGAIGGCLLQSVVLKCSALVGGSPGLYAFYSAHVATVLMNWKEMSHPFVQLIIFGILIAFDAIRSFVLHSYDEEVSHLSHIGGVGVGLLMGVIVLRNIKVTRIEKKIWYASVGILSSLAIIFVIWTASLDC